MIFKLLLYSLQTTYLKVSLFSLCVTYMQNAGYFLQMLKHAWFCVWLCTHMCSYTYAVTWIAVLCLLQIPQMPSKFYISKWCLHCSNIITMHLLLFCLVKIAHMCCMLMQEVFAIGGEQIIYSKLFCSHYKCKNILLMFSAR